jgi:hypothetical protein
MSCHYLAIVVVCGWNSEAKYTSSDSMCQQSFLAEQYFVQLYERCRPSPIIPFPLPIPCLSVCFHHIVTKGFIGRCGKPPLCRASPQAPSGLDPIGPLPLTQRLKTREGRVNQGEYLRCRPFLRGSPRGCSTEPFRQSPHPQPLPLRHWQTPNKAVGPCAVRRA